MKNQLKIFGLKMSIFFLGLFLFSALTIPDVEDIQNITLKLLRSERSKIILLGLIQNPVALKKLSEIDEKSGKLEMAALDMELAIGLLNSRDANQELLDSYSSRLENLSRQRKNN